MSAAARMLRYWKLLQSENKDREGVPFAVLLFIIGREKGGSGPTGRSPYGKERRNQMRDRASSSATRMKSLWYWRMEAGT